MEKIESKELAGIVVFALKEKLAEDVKVLEIDEISPIADYFVIASGRNANHTEAMIEAVEEAAEKNGFFADHKEGHKRANWTLIDFKGVVVHVFDEEGRQFYDLDHIWKDGKEVTLDV